MRYLKLEIAQLAQLADALAERKLYEPCSKSTAKPKNNPCLNSNLPDKPLGFFDG